ncbi:MAG: translocation/assembly module TamB [Acidobacteriaceae bacterium]|jgi:autotransporter translocation and assembly factor TamB|nr:translocation/assembly module TamB [Acidobacteriaceae bacterium]
MTRLGRLLASITRGIIFLAAFVLGLALLLLLVIQTAWAKDHLRQFIVAQANRSLTATLQIDHLDGSLFHDVHLSGVTLLQDGQPIVQIDDIAVDYTIRELFQHGTSITRIALVHPHIVAAKNADGAWNLTTLVRPDTQPQQPPGPVRPLRLLSILVTGGRVELRDPLELGALQLPSAFDDLHLDMAFDNGPAGWHAAVADVSWRGAEPSFSVTHLTGTIGNSADVWQFKTLHVETPKGALDVDGMFDPTVTPSRVQLHAHAHPFDFQEWAQILPALSRITIASEFDASLDGPLSALRTNIDLTSNGGNARGEVTLDTTIPGWRFAGALQVAQFNLAPWISRPDQPSNISGRVQFDLALPPGARFPQGTYQFNGPRVSFMQYDARDLIADGRLTATEVLIRAATTTAYGASVRLGASTIGLDAPYDFHFAGTADHVDLRRVPSTVPVPRVESTLSFAFDARGRFEEPFLASTARFSPSTFLGATIGDGATGAIDTSASPLTYSGEGEISNIDLNAFGRGLNIDWMQDPRYDGVIEGHFHVDGSGSEPETMALSGGGHIRDAHLFGGELSDADVSIDISDGSLTSTYDGAITHLDPAVPMEDERYTALMYGHGHGQVSIRDLMTHSPDTNDYAIDATLELAAGSGARGIDIDQGSLTASLKNGTLAIDRFDARGPAIDASAHGTLTLDDSQQVQLTYDIRRSDLPALETLMGRAISGQLVTAGTLTGSLSELHVTGSGTLSNLDEGSVRVLTATADYDATVPMETPDKAVAKISGDVTLIDAVDQPLSDVTGTVAFDAGETSFDLTLTQPNGPSGTVTGRLDADIEQRTANIHALSMTLDQASWTLAATGARRLSWDERGVALSQFEFVDAVTGQQHVSVDGSWRFAGDGLLHVIATNVSLDALFSTDGAPGQFGGALSLDMTVTGTRDAPNIGGTVRIDNGRVWRTAFDSVGGRVNFTDRTFDLDIRLDQSPGVWLTAAGTVPLGAVLDSASESERPVDLTIRSTPIDLALLEGLTDAVTDVSGRIQIETRVVGTRTDPRFDGRLDIENAAFRLAASGSRYKNGRLALSLTTDSINVDAFRLEDIDGHPLEVKGSLATQELRVSDLAIDIRARSFEVLHNEYGRIDIDAELSLQGQLEAPRLAGRISVSSGQLQADTILDRALFQPYTTVATNTNLDAVAALNPWDLLGLDLELRVPNTLRIIGDNLQVAPDTPIGLGAINLRALGDLYLYKDPHEPLYVTGSLDSLTGTYAFQGRRFDLDPSSSVTFLGDITPNVFITVSREISGVDTRVTITGSLKEPELRLTSTPPLEPSDILSLIVFNTSSSGLSSLQQQQLAVRAGTLAAGFFTAPILGALERTLGLDQLEIEPFSALGGTSTRITVGNEIAPGLVARFSRQFGDADYDEATLEYFLSRLFRIRATFSDANTLTVSSPFRRVERAGIDLLIILNF